MSTDTLAHTNVHEKPKHLGGDGARGKIIESIARSENAADCPVITHSLTQDHPSCPSSWGTKSGSTKTANEKHTHRMSTAATPRARRHMPVDRLAVRLVGIPAAPVEPFPVVDVPVVWVCLAARNISTVFETPNFEPVTLVIDDLESDATLAVAYTPFWTALSAHSADQLSRQSQRVHHLQAVSLLGMA